MLYSISYKDQNLTKQLHISGANISNVIVYCDANNINPSILSIQNSEVVLNNPSSEICYMVVLQDQSENKISYQVYDTFSGLVSWINTQTGKTVKNISEQIKPFVNA